MLVGLGGGRLRARKRGAEAAELVDGGVGRAARDGDPVVGADVLDEEGPLGERDAVDLDGRRVRRARRRAAQRERAAFELEGDAVAARLGEGLLELTLTLTLTLTLGRQP